MSEKTIDLAGLGYIGVNTKNPLGFRDFATSVCGLAPSGIVPGPRRAGMPIPSPEAEGVAADGSVYLKMDQRQWRIAAHPSAVDGLAYLGFEVRSTRDFEDASELLQKRGVAVRAGTDSERAARSVARLAVFEDPAGHQLELFQGPIVDGDFISPQGVFWKTGDLGMGHVVLFVAEIDESLAFYRDVLGFERTDYMNFGPDGQGIHFLRCNQRHHSVALLQIGPASGLQHMMLESKTLDGVGEALDRAISQGIPITSSLGRHRNDKTVSFYMQGPAGFNVEIGWDAVIVGDDWVEHEFAGGGDDWGHHGLTAESLQPDD